MHLAEFNFGTLKHDWDDPRLADFQNNLDLVNDIAARHPGFVWRLSDDEMEAVQENPNGPLADRPNTASTLSVWKSAADLYDFAMKTAHARFLERGGEWFKADDRSHLVVWWIEEGHSPTVVEAMSHWRDLQRKGETKAVFSAVGLKKLAEENSKKGVS